MINKKIIASLILVSNLYSQTIYECGNTKLTVDNITVVTSKKPTIIVDTDWIGKPTMVNVYLRDRSKDLFNESQFRAINKQTSAEWLTSSTIFNGPDGSTLIIYDLKTYYLIQTDIPSKKTFTSNECVKSN